MRILYISNRNVQGGATKALISIMSGMSKRGHEIYLITDNDYGPLTQAIIQIGGNQILAPISTTLYAKGGKFYGRIWRTLQKYIGWRKTKEIIATTIEKYSIDLVHTNVGPLNLAFSICNRKKIPHIWHQREFFDSLGSSFFPYNAKFYDVIKSKGNYNICITNQVFCHCRLERSNNNTIIYDGVFSEKDLMLLPKSEKKKYFLFVGHIEYNKAPHDLIQAFAEFHKIYPDYRLLLAGHYDKNDKYYKKCNELVSTYHLESYVDFLGLRNDIYELMASSTALVAPSYFEGFGFIIVEAMLNNTVVIGRNTSGIKEQFDIGLSETGIEIGYRFNDVSELLNKMILSVEEDTSEMRLKAKSVVLNHYTTEKCNQATEGFYFKCINSCRND